MGAIVGLFYRDGRPVARETIARMTAALAHRGPHGLAIWHAGPVGLGLCALWPTGLIAQAPGALVVADMRLDNQDELREALGGALPAGPAADPALLLAAYRRWGCAFPERLLGDFSLAIWDEQERTLLCARDQLGVKPLYYYRSDRIFAFATELKALLALAEVPRRINAERARSYLMGAALDPAETFFAGLARLPAAHWVAVTADAAAPRRYWALDPTREIRLASDAAYAEQFRALFSAAVRCRMQAAAPVGALLSGGLDSSAITSTARAIRRSEGRGDLPVISAHFPTVAACDETPYIDAILSQGGCAPLRVVGDQALPWGEPQRRLWHMEEPHHAPGIALRWELLAAARAGGVGVVLDGSGGDEVVSHGDGYLYQLARTQRWPTLARELYWVSRAGGERYSELLWDYFWAAGVAPAARRLRRRLRGDRRPAPDGPRDERAVHAHSLTASVQPLGLEVLDRVAGAYGIELRYPFWDRRLVEFCLALPPGQKLRQGMGRYVLREAMRGTLPEVVRLRTDKIDFFANLIYGMRHFERDRIMGLLRDDESPAAPYLDLPALRAVARRVVDPAGRATPAEALALWRAITFSLWMEPGPVSAAVRPTDAAPGQDYAVALGRVLGA